MQARPLGLAWLMGVRAGNCIVPALMPLYLVGLADVGVGSQDAVMAWLLNLVGLMRVRWLNAIVRHTPQKKETCSRCANRLTYYKH